ncbi:hypothetical protein [Desulfovibrio sp. X2]|uniref:hypothetical protein n=1 Tax=Desulfovibrio sp. X2 TaxID=941449 RepID=UPI00041A2F67|nr:hypothetical protein [Desulfovibrio sp. X2]
MLVCLACHEGRLATLLETAEELRLFEVTPQGAAAHGVLPGPARTSRTLAGLLCGKGVAALVCGGLTRADHAALSRCGVSVHAWLAGGIPEILEALRAGRLDRMLMPGCSAEGWGESPDEG